MCLACVALVFHQTLSGFGGLTADRSRIPAGVTATHSVATDHIVAQRLAHALFRVAKKSAALFAWITLLTA